jgi:acyl-CoA hydrolase
VGFLLSGTTRGTGSDWSELHTDPATVADNKEEVKMEGRAVEHSAITMSQLILPEQVGRAGFAHGGEIMKLMDTAAGTAALRHAHRDLVTARVEGINFYRPIKIWNLITINAFLTFVGRSSMEFGLTSSVRM